MGLDESHPEYLNYLDVVSLSWLTSLCSIVWPLGRVPLDWPTQVVERPESVCSNYEWSHSSASLGKYYRVLEMRITPTVEPQFQEEQCGFHPGR